jgi:hypothetical protein
MVSEINIEVTGTLRRDDSIRALANLAAFAVGEVVSGMEALVIAQTEEGTLAILAIPPPDPENPVFIETTRERWRHVLALNMLNTGLPRLGRREVTP